MAYINIIISSDAKISVSKDQLIIYTDKENSVPLEDICSVVIDNNVSVITNYTLSAFAEKGVALYICDKKHMPCGVFIPFNTYSRRLKQIKLQISQTLPSQKRLWQQLVTGKIKNQAMCLNFCGCANTEELNKLANNVNSGDTKNIEGTAAALYFKSLFGKNFTRSLENDINAALNYGYAIFRGYISRTLACYGYEPSLGIHHKSELNNFNLSDDIIEPFRPLVDLYIKSCDDLCFDSTVKHGLINLLNVDILYDDRHFSVAYAIEKFVQNLSAYYNSKINTLPMPEIVPLEQHSYE